MPEHHHLHPPADGGPHPHLVEEVTGLPPSTALAVGCGEGADAIWLTQQGWRVTSLDGEPGDATYGLVWARLGPLPHDDLARMHRRLASVVRPGGTLLVVGPHPDDRDDPLEGTGPGGRSTPPTVAQVAQVAHALDADAWEVLVAGPRTRQETDPETGEPVTVTDAVLRARRRLVGAGSVWRPDGAAEDPRGEGTGTDERSTLTDYLAHYRTTFELKCGGLDAEQLARRSVPPSTLSLLGLLRHLAGVEQIWFRTRLSGIEGPRHYREHGPDGEFDGAVADDAVVERAWATWREEVANASAYVDAAPSMDHVGADGSVLRDVLVHMIEEYARHCGHADLLRECVDGRVGQ